MLPKMTSIVPVCGMFRTPAQDFDAASLAGVLLTLSADGTSIADSCLLPRIRSVAIPPAWTEVWILPICGRAYPGCRTRRPRGASSIATTHASARRARAPNSSHRVRERAVCDQAPGPHDANVVGANVREKLVELDVLLGIGVHQIVKFEAL